MVGFFTLGAMVGGVTLGLAVWSISGLAVGIATTTRVTILLIVVALAALRDIGVLRFELPQLKRQVPQSIFRKEAAFSALQFGFELGTGVLTYVTSTLVYVMILALLLLAPPLASVVAVGAGFGLGRAALPALRLAGSTGEEWDGRLLRRIRWILPGLSVAVCLTTLLLAAQL